MYILYILRHITISLYTYESIFVPLLLLHCERFFSPQSGILFKIFTGQAFRDDKSRRAARLRKSKKSG